MTDPVVTRPMTGERLFCHCVGGSTYGTSDPNVRLCDLCGGVVTTPPSVETAARVLATWLGTTSDGQSDRDISPEFHDWCFDGVGNLKMQGGKPALRRVAVAMLAAAGGATDAWPDWRPAETAPKGIVHSVGIYSYGVRILATTTDGEVHVVRWYQQTDEPDMCAFVDENGTGQVIRGWMPLPDPMP